MSSQITYKRLFIEPKPTLSTQSVCNEVSQIMQSLVVDSVAEEGEVAFEGVVGEDLCQFGG